VYFAGYRKDAVAWMKSLDLYVQSSWGEGMGSVLLEAMACAIPIVATAAGGIPEVIDNGATGLLVNPVSPDALGKAILESMDLPSQAQARSAKALAGLHRFGLCRLGREVSDIYQGLGHTAALA
jgi:glycosyltransferase involved in cell wall biosynthesis